MHSKLFPLHTYYSAPNVFSYFLIHFNGLLVDSCELNRPHVHYEISFLYNKYPESLYSQIAYPLPIFHLNYNNVHVKSLNYDSRICILYLA